MQTILLVNGSPETPLPSDATTIFCNGINYYCYFLGDEIPPEHQPPATPEPQPEPDWSLAGHLRGSQIFAKSFAAASEVLPASTAFNLLLSSLQWQNLNDLRFAFNALRAAMPSTTAGDFTVEELQTVSDLLTQHNFPLDDFNLS